MFQKSVFFLASQMFDSHFTLSSALSERNKQKKVAAMELFLSELK